MITGVGSSSDINWDYMYALKNLVNKIQPEWISDHLSFSSFKEHYYHDLIPIPYTLKSAKYVAGKIIKIQEFFKLPFLLENVSNYMQYESSDMLESDFLNEISDLSGASLLLDINNIYVNSQNFSFDPYQFVDNINLASVKQIHLAGYSIIDGVIIDTHSTSVSKEVFELYTYCLKKSKVAIPTCLEWDTDIPSFKPFYNEYQKIVQVYEKNFRL